MISNSRLKSHHPSPKIKMVNHAATTHIAFKQGPFYVFILTGHFPDGTKSKLSCLAKSACKTSVSVKEHVIKLPIPLREPFRSGLSTYYLSFIWAADHSAAPINAIMCTPLMSHDLPALLIEHIAALHLGAGVEQRYGSEGGTLVQQWTLLPLTSCTDTQFLFL